MTDLHQLYGSQLDDVLEAWKWTLQDLSPVPGCVIADLLTEYYERLGLEPDGSNAITVTQTVTGDNVWGEPVVNITLDGYRVEFVHNPGFVVPPPVCWDKL